MQALRSILDSCRPHSLKLQAVFGCLPWKISSFEGLRELILIDLRLEVLTIGAYLNSLRRLDLSGCPALQHLQEEVFAAPELCHLSVLGEPCCTPTVQQSHLHQRQDHLCNCGLLVEWYQKCKHASQSLIQSSARWPDNVDAESSSEGWSPCLVNEPDK